MSKKKTRLKLLKKIAQKNKDITDETEWDNEGSSEDTLANKTSLLEGLDRLSKSMPQFKSHHEGLLESQERLKLIQKSLNDDDLELEEIPQELQEKRKAS